MITESTKLARLLAEILRLSAADVESDERWAGVAELRQLDAEQIYAIGAELSGSIVLIERELGADLLGSYKILQATQTTLRLRAIEILVGLLRDGEPRVLASALYALGNLEASDRIPGLARLAAHDCWWVRLALARSLPSEESEHSIETLIVLSRDRNEDVRDWATFGLGSQCDVDTDPVRAALFDRVTDEHFDTRSEALIGLARRGDDRASEAVLAALREEVVGELAVEAASLLGREDFLPELRNLKSWWDVNDDLLERAIRRCEGREDQESEGTERR